MARLDWHIEAASDLDAVAEFIARNSPAQASSFVARIVAAAERLRDQPNLGRVVPELEDASCRELIFQNYRIVYRIMDDRVTILAIIHGRWIWRGRCAAGRGTSPDGTEIFHACPMMPADEQRH